jgi:ethanolamine ammonia-lyase small subunit
MIVPVMCAADFAAQGLRLSEPHMVGVCRAALADQAGVGRDEPQVCLIAEVPQLGDGQSVVLDDWTFRASSQMMIVKVLASGRVFLAIDACLGFGLAGTFASN